MSAVRLYLPAFALGAWSMTVAFGAILPSAFWMVVFAAAMVVNVRENRRR